MSLRLGLALGTLVFILWAPFVSLACAVFSAFRFRSFEIIVIAFVVDMLLLPPGHVPLLTLCAMVLVWGCEPLREEFA